MIFFSRKRIEDAAYRRGIADAAALAEFWAADQLQQARQKTHIDTGLMQLSQASTFLAAEIRELGL